MRSYVNWKKLGLVACANHPSYREKYKNRRIATRAGLGKK
jgi:hypothetical protein